MGGKLALRRFLVTLLFLLAGASVTRANQAARGWCESGAQVVITSGLTSTTTVQASYPACTVTVFVHGGGLATIYSDNNSTPTPLANPFTAAVNGQWILYAPNGRYDIQLSGAGFPTPVTYSDVLLSDAGVGGIVFGVYSGPTPFSTTPVFNAAAASIFSITLTGNVTSSSVINPVQNGQVIELNVNQDGAGGHSFALPANFTHTSCFNLGTPGNSSTSSTWWFDGLNWQPFSCGGGGVVGILPVSQGGTGASTLAAHGVLLGEGTGPIVSVLSTNTAQCFMSDPTNFATVDPSFQSCPGGTGSSSAGPQGTINAAGVGGAFQITNLFESGTTLNVDDNAQFKGPDPYISASRYNVRATLRQFMPNIGGVTVTISGGSLGTGTISTNSCPLQPGGICFQKGDAVTTFGGGAPTALSTPAAPTVTPANAVGVTNSGLFVASPTASTSYQFCLSALGQVSQTACGPFTTITNGQATLGPITRSISSDTFSNNTMTVVTSSAMPVSIGATCQIYNTANFFNYEGAVATVSGTTLTFTVASSDTRNGAPTTTGTLGNITCWNQIHVKAAGLPAGATTSTRFAVYGGVGSATDYLGMIKPAGNLDPTDVTYLVFDWYGATFSPPLRPFYVSATAPVAATNESFNTTITNVSGTTLTFASNATTAVTGATILLDQAQNITTCLNQSANGGSSTCRLPSTTAGYFVLNTQLTIPNNTVLETSGANGSGGIWANDTISFPGATGDIIGRLASNQQNVSQFEFTHYPTIDCGNAWPCMSSLAKTKLEYLAISVPDGGLGFFQAGTQQIPATDWDYVYWNHGGQGYSNTAYYCSGLHVGGAAVTNSTWRRINFEAAQLGFGSMQTPAFINNGCGNWAFPETFFSGKGRFWRPATPGLIIETDILQYSQGNYMPFDTIYNVDGGAIGVNYIQHGTDIFDTTFSPLTSTSSGIRLNLISDGIVAAPSQPLTTGSGNVYLQNGPGGFSGQFINQVQGPIEQLVADPVLQYALKAVVWHDADLGIGALYSIHTIENPPAAPTCPVSAGGSVPMGTIVYAYAYVYADGGQGSTSQGCTATTSGGNQTVTVTVPPQAGAVAYSFYRAVNGGTLTLANATSCNVFQSFSNVFVDTFSFTCGSAAPGFPGSGPAGMRGTLVWGDIYPRGLNPLLGYPLISGTNGKVSATSTSLDASVQAGADICAKIAATWIALAASPFSGGGGVANASAFHGQQSCAGSMFASFPAGFTGTLLLAPDVIINSDVSQVMPSAGVMIDGNSAHPTSTPNNNVGAVIRASNAFAANQPVISMGSSLSFGNKLKYLRVSCVPPSGTVPTGCITVQNQWCQEGCSVTNAWLSGGSDTNLDITSSQAQNSGPYENITMSADNVNNAAATCARIGSASTTALRAAIALRHISCGGGNNTATQLIGISLDASSVSIEDYHIEQVVTGIEVGANRFVTGSTIFNGNCTSTASKPMTSCIDISASNGSPGLTIIGNQTPAATNVTNALVDNQPNGQTVTVAAEGGVGWYTRGNNNSVNTTSGLGGTNGSFNSVLNTYSGAHTLTPQENWANYTVSTTSTIPHAIAGHHWVVFCVSPCATLTLAPDVGNITLNNATGATASITTGLGVEVSCDGTNCFAWGLGGSGGGGSGTVASCSVNGIAYYTAATTVNCTPAFTTPAGVPYTVTSTPSGGVTQPPTLSLPGIVGRAVSGTAVTDTILSTDCNPNRVEYVGSVAVAVTLPTAVTLGVPKCVFKLVNTTVPAQTVTITPTTWTINGNATLALTFGQQLWVYVDPNSTTNWVADQTDLFGNVSGAAVPASAKLIGTNSNSQLIAAALLNTHLYVGSAGNLPVDVAVSGDVSLANTGAFTVLGANGGTFPASAAVLGTNSSKQPIAATAHGVGLPLQCADTSGSGSVQVCNTTPTFTPVAGDSIIYTTTTANTGASLTLNVNSLGAKPAAKWQTTTTLVANDVRANTEVLATYDGTNWELATIGNVPSGGGGGTPCTTTNLSLQYDNSGAFGCVTEFTYASSTITASSTGKIDLSAGSVTAGFKLPSASGAAPTAAGIISYNTTTNALEVGNGTNTSTPTWTTASVTSGQCPQFSGTAGLLVGITCTALNPPFDKSASGLSNPTADATFTQPSTSTTGWTLAGTAPASVSTSTGTNATSLFNVNGVIGGGDSNATGTAGIGSSPTIAAGAGGAGTGTNTVGGAGGSVTLTAGSGGASAGTGANSNGGNVVITPGSAGTGGSGAAGHGGVLQVGAAECTVPGTAGGLCMAEGTEPTNVSGATTLAADSTTHEIMVATNGASTATPGMLLRSQPSPINQTGKTAAITTATLCASAAGACNTAGQYHIHFNFWGSGTACSSVTAGSVNFQLTWTDENATAHSAVIIPVLSQTGATSVAQGNSFLFQTALANESASGDVTISTNGSVIQYATGYTACTTGTGTYNLRAAVTRVQ